MSVFESGFWEGKRVFLTGHTGFKGSWLSRILINAGADLTGYSLPPQTEPALFSICGVESQMNSVIGDIRDSDKLKSAFKQSSPEIVFHLAAQPIVREGYKNPVYTYETNVMGTVNILECVRLSNGVKSFLNVTTDKVYENRKRLHGYREDDRLNGFDPYSNSKSCSELVTRSYKNSFFGNVGGVTAISTARAGNVIGGGDFAVDRIIPDCIRAASKGDVITVRNPYSVRPYQHLLEPLFAYLMIAQSQYQDVKYAGSYNVGPDDGDCINTAELTDLFCILWGNEQSWVNQHDSGPYEAKFLKLDCTKLKMTFGWEPCWNITKAVEKTIEWSKKHLTGGNICDIMDKQIIEFKKLFERGRT